MSFTINNQKNYYHSSQLDSCKNHEMITQTNNDAEIAKILQLEEINNAFNKNYNITLSEIELSNVLDKTIELNHNSSINEFAKISTFYNVLNSIKLIPVPSAPPIEFSNNNVFHNLKHELKHNIYA